MWGFVWSRLAQTRYVAIKTSASSASRRASSRLASAGSTSSAAQCRWSAASASARVGPLLRSAKGSRCTPGPSCRRRASRRRTRNSNRVTSSVLAAVLVRGACQYREARRLASTARAALGVRVCAHTAARIMRACSISPADLSSDCGARRIPCHLRRSSRGRARSRRGSCASEVVVRRRRGSLELAASLSSGRAIEPPSR